MKVAAFTLACLLPIAPACSVYTSELRTERFVTTDRFSPDGVPDAVLPASDGVTVVRKGGVKTSFPGGTQVTKVSGGIAVDPGPGVALEMFANDEVLVVELRAEHYREVRHRVRSESGSAALTILSVVAVTAAVVGGAVALGGAMDFGNPFGAGFGSGGFGF